MTRRKRIPHHLVTAIRACLCGALCIALVAPALAYVEIPYTLGRLVQESTNIMKVQVEKVDKEKNLIIFRKLADIKGTHAGDTIKHNIGRGGFHPREWQTIMNWAEPGKIAVFMHNGGASEMCIHNYWYQAYAGDWWGMSHGEPYLLRTFAGNPDKLASLITAMLAGQEVVVPCMVDTDKQAIQLGTAKIQRLRASLKLQEYDPKRDFVGWGGEDFRSLAGMPAFTRLATISRVDPNARGVAVCGAKDAAGQEANPLCCFYGDGRVSLVQINGPALSEVSLPFNGGARSAAFADYNGDGRGDLLLATGKGPVLLANTSEAFRDDSGGLPQENYRHTLAAAWIRADGDAHPDILVADGFQGLRLYRNLGPASSGKATEPAIGPWHYAGPFDNSGNRGFDTAYPPEQSVDLTATYAGKGNRPVAWKKGAFTDGQINNLAIFEGDGNADSTVYLYREFNVSSPTHMPASFGSDDSLKVWLNGELVVAANESRGCTPDQNLATLKLRGGKNRLLLKIGQGSGDFAFYFAGKGDLVSVPPLFEDVTHGMGLGPQGVAGKLKGDSLTVGDFNGDGRDDFVYAAGRGVVALNTPQGFVEVKNAGLDFAAGGVNLVLGQFNGDKHLDLFVPQNGACKLFAGQGTGAFVDITAQAGDLARPIAKASGACLVDFNGDGQGDLFVSCLRGPNRFFRNQQGKFVEASDELGLYQKVFNTRALAVADVNRDGSPDLLCNNEGQDSTLLLGKPPAAEAAKVGLAPPVPTSR